MAEMMASEACAQLGVSQQRVYWYMVRDRITYRHVGRTVLIDPEVLRSELEEQGYFQRAAKWKQARKSEKRAARVKEKELAAQQG